MEKIKTYVEGLDEQLDGGIPKGSIVLIAGAPGTMKSSLAYSILYNNALKDIQGVYLTLEQGDVPALMKGLGYDHEKVGEKVGVLDIGELRYAIDDLSAPVKLSRKDKGDVLGLEFYMSQMRSIRTKIGYQILVIDSLEALESIIKLENRRYEFFYLFKWLKELQSTIFIISEVEPNMLSGTRYDEGYLADGIIHLTLQKVNEVESQRRLQVPKMRGVKHSTDTFALMFEKGGFQVTSLMRQ
jgi:KaiC/GvpD/RAD55 family RecA-like ATPase